MYGPGQVSISRSGFAWADSEWRFLAFDGQRYAYASTGEGALSKLLAVCASTFGPMVSDV